LKWLLEGIGFATRGGLIAADFGDVLAGMDVLLGAMAPGVGPAPPPSLLPGQTQDTSRTQGLQMAAGWTITTTACS